MTRTQVLSSNTGPPRERDCGSLTSVHPAYLDTKMPPKSGCRGQNQQVQMHTPRSDTPASRQTRMVPAPRTVTGRRTPATLPRTKQSTLTQIDFVPRSNQQEEENNLEYLEPEILPPKRKRRKTTHGPPALSRDNTLTQTDFIKRKKTPQDEEDLIYVQEEDRPQQDKKQRYDIPAEGVVGESMPKAPIRRTKRTYSKVHVHKDGDAVSAPQRRPPRRRQSPPDLVSLPRTPKKIFKREIESSQSPEASPISTQSPAKVRSPLKEVSANRGMRNKAAAKLIGKPPLGALPESLTRTPRLKVEDTFEPGSSSSLSTQQQTADAFYHRERNIMKTEIEDSEEEPDSDGVDDLHHLEDDQHLARPTTMPQLPNLNPSVSPGILRMSTQINRPLLDTSSSLTSLPSSDPPLPSHVDIEDHADKDVLPPQRSTSFTSPLAPPETANYNNPVTTDAVVAQPPTSDFEPTLPTQPWIKGDHVMAEKCQQQPSSDLGLPLPPIKEASSSFRRSDSVQASAQLLGDLSRYTQPRPANKLVAETESQFENAFRSLHSSDLAADLSSDSLPFAERKQSSANHEKNRQQITTSQASTIDVTQLTQRTPRGSRSSAKTSPTTSMDKNRHSTARKAMKSPLKGNSKQVVALSSSSPTTDRHAADPVQAYDKKRTTDSQLLPDSIMNFELPPLSSQLDLDDDEL
jgi:hypothetical protein